MTTTEPDGVKYDEEIDKTELDNPRHSDYIIDKNNDDQKTEGLDNASYNSFQEPEDSTSRPESVQELPNDSILRGETSTFRQPRIESFPPAPDSYELEKLNNPELSIDQREVQSEESINFSMQESSTDLQPDQPTDEKVNSESNFHTDQEAVTVRGNSNLYDGYTKDIIEQNALELGPDMPRGETEDSPPVRKVHPKKYKFSRKRLFCGIVVVLIGIAVGLGVSLGLKGFFFFFNFINISYFKKNALYY